MTITDPLAIMWAKRRLAQLERAQLCRNIEALNAEQAKLRPLLRAAEERRKANMRQDGPNGFVMVQK